MKNFPGSKLAIVVGLGVSLLAGGVSSALAQEQTARRILGYVDANSSKAKITEEIQKQDLGEVRNVIMNGNVYRANIITKADVIPIFVDNRIGAIEDQTPPSQHQVAVSMEPGDRIASAKAGLEALGYENVRDLKEEGRFIVAAVDYLGMTDRVSINTQTNRVTDSYSGDNAFGIGRVADGTSEAEIVRRLEAQGVTNAKVNSWDGNAIRVEGTYNGQAYTGTIDARTGTLRTFADPI